MRVPRSEIEPENYRVTAGNSGGALPAERVSATGYTLAAHGIPRWSGGPDSLRCSSAALRLEIRQRVETDAIDLLPGHREHRLPRCAALDTDIANAQTAQVIDTVTITDRNGEGGRARVEITVQPLTVAANPPEVVQEALRTVSVKMVQQWARSKLGRTLASLRRTFLGRPKKRNKSCPKPTPSPEPQFSEPV